MGRRKGSLSKKNLVQHPAAAFAKQFIGEAAGHVRLQYGLYGLLSSRHDEIDPRPDAASLIGVIFAGEGLSQAAVNREDTHQWISSDSFLTLRRSPFSALTSSYSAAIGFLSPTIQ